MPHHTILCHTVPVHCSLLLTFAPPPHHELMQGKKDNFHASLPTAQASLQGLHQLIKAKFGKCDLRCLTFYYPLPSPHYWPLQTEEDFQVRGGHACTQHGRGRLACM